MRTTGECCETISGQNELSKERLDDVIDVQLPQMRVLLARAHKENGLPSLVAHRQRSTHLNVASRAGRRVSG